MRTHVIIRRTAYIIHNTLYLIGYRYGGNRTGTSGGLAC